MFTFLKKISGLFTFKKKETPVETLSVPLEQLDEWLRNHTFHPEKEIHASLVKLKEDLAEQVAIAQKNLTVLEHATLRNENIAVRERQIMEGNRTQYVRGTNNFLLLFSPSKDAADVKEFFHDLAERYPQEVSTYSNTTLKAFQVLQHFFEHETRNVSQSIKKIDELMQSLHTLLQEENVTLINSCRDSVQQFRDQVLMRQYIQVKIHELEELQQEDKRQRDAYFLKIEKLKQSPGFAQYNSLVAERDALTHEFDEHRIQFEHLTALLAKALSKFVYQKPDEKFVKRYLTDPVSALLEDELLQFFTLLQQLRDAVTHDLLELKDQKKAKTVQVLDSLSRDKLSALRQRLLELQKKKMEHDKSVRGNVVMQEYHDLKYKADHYEYKIKKYGLNIIELQQKYQEIKLDIFKEKLEGELLNCTGKQVVILLQESQTLPETVQQDQEKTSKKIA